MKVACSPEAWPPRRPPAPSTTSKVCSPEEAWPPRRPPAPSTTRKVWHPAPPAPNRRVWGAIGAIVLLQTATIAAVLAPRAETDARRRLLDEEMIEPPLLKVREDHDLGEADERRRLSGALWGLKTVTTCVEINQCAGCTRQFFTKSFLGDDAAVLARSSVEEPAPPRYRAGVASMAWRTTR